MTAHDVNTNGSIKESRPPNGRGRGYRCAAVTLSVISWWKEHSVDDVNNAIAGHDVSRDDEGIIHNNGSISHGNRD
jgi:hypothetical protein